MTRIRVKVGTAEAEVDADPEHLQEAIDLVPELASKLTEVRVEEPLQARPQARLEAQTPSEQRRQVQFPTVALQKGDSLTEAIGKFFADPWGMERRKLSDVRGALESYGLNYPKQSVAVALLRLAKTTKIRRFRGDDGEFVYTSSSMMPRVTSVVEALPPDQLPGPQPN